MKKNVLCIILILIAVILGICSWFLLPAEVIVQVGFDGQPSNTMPKLFAVIVPTMISIVGSVIHMKSNEINSYKGLVISVVGIFIVVACLFFNR